MTGATHQVVIPRFGRMLTRIALMFDCALAGAFCLPISALRYSGGRSAGICHWLQIIISQCSLSSHDTHEC
jgi:hypothetical protein